MAYPRAGGGVAWAPSPPAMMGGPIGGIGGIGGIHPAGGIGGMMGGANAFHPQLGDRVEAYGMKFMKELNGRVGTVVKAVNREGRLLVAFDPPIGNRAMMMQNLREAPQDDNPATAIWVCQAPNSEGKACGFRNRPTNDVCGGVGGSLGCKEPRPEPGAAPAPAAAAAAPAAARRDPFAAAPPPAADPFGGPAARKSADPFAGTTFGDSPAAADPFGGSAAADPFAGADPFGAAPTRDPFAACPDPFAAAPDPFASCPDPGTAAPARGRSRDRDRR